MLLMTYLFIFMFDMTYYKRIDIKKIFIWRKMHSKDYNEKLQKKMRELFHEGKETET